MNKPSDDLLTALESEVLGEAAFRSAYYAARFSGRREAAKALWDLEAQTKRRILDYFEVHNLQVPTLWKAALGGTIFGILYPLLPWKQILKETLKATDHYLEVFRRLEQQAPEEDKALFSYIVAHEMAIKKFAEIEMRAGNNDSLEPIRQLLSA